MNTMTQQEIINFIEQRTGIVLNERNRIQLGQLLDDLLKTQDLESMFEHLASKTYNDALWQRIIQTITIGETYFFRNKSHIQALRKTILPALIQHHRDTGFKQLRIWSAGCATGEEPYTLAMLIYELIDDIRDWSISILATDINDAYLSLGRHGVYARNSFRAETEADITEKWFDQVDNTHYRVKSYIHQMVTFSHLNLVQDMFPSFDNYTANMDLIMCRNVTIYFDQMTTRRIVDQFYDAINRGGWLIVGHSEPNMSIYRNFDTVNLENTVAYRKSEDINSTTSVNEATITRNIPVPAPAKPSPPKPVIESKPRQVEPRTHTWSPSPTTEPNQAKSSRKSLALAELLKQAEQAADSGKWSEALQLLDKIEQQDKLNPMLHYLRGIVYMERGKTSEALDSLRQAIYCDADFIMAHYMVGDIYIREGDRNKADHHWRRAHKLAKYLPALKVVPGSSGMSANEFVELITYRLNEIT